ELLARRNEAEVALAMATQQSSPVDVTEAVPPDRLGPWLAANVPGARAGVRLRQLAGGPSNLTFRVQNADPDWGVARPPLRGVLATAHDMNREYRVQSALQATDVPVSPQVVACTDDAVIGAPFYLMEYLDGVVYDDADAVAGLSEAQS